VVVLLVLLAAKGLWVTKADDESSTNVIVMATNARSRVELEIVMFLSAAAKKYYSIPGGP